MHFVGLVITEERPTEEVLSKALVQFGPDGEGKWDWWTLGGRYTGNLRPLELENTMTGGPDLPHIEMMLIKTMGAKLPGRTGPGVDALRHKNLAGVYNELLPHAVVFNGQWHECEVISVESLARGLGFDVNIPAKELKTERAGMRRWITRFDALMSDVPAESWISVIDCHN